MPIVLFALLLFGVGKVIMLSSIMDVLTGLAIVVVVSKFGAGWAMVSTKSGRAEVIATANKRREQESKRREQESKDKKKDKKENNKKGNKNEIYN
jgi:mannitol-specific phosphotransferase system IIBC component